MRVPSNVIGKENIPLIEEFLGESLRKIGIGKTEKLVFRKDQWEKFLHFSETNSNLSESSSVVLRAYTMLMKNYPEAKKTPEGRVAIIAAVMAIYAADPGVGSRLQFALSL